ncbi:unnamed protein product [Psylliodes chrysocephalus]|uniref:Uncharacterized protein n=1 Tax=Psylliodes chrysocephalus TaxID=3402493 RepID=A0A9P0CXV3_9CUCU|nr:unnamed protein product [Psylliodes chrysocephala]
MAYAIIRNNNGWVLNENGQVFMRDTENGANIWIDNNMIYFNEYQRPCIKIYNEHDPNPKEIILTFSNSDELEDLDDAEPSQNLDGDNTDKKKKIASKIKNWKIYARQKFVYYERMDEILGETPTNSSPHSIDTYNIIKNQVEENTQVEKFTENCNVEQSSENTKYSDNSKKKRRNLTADYMELKKKYYEEKKMESQDKKQQRENYIEEALKLKKERNMQMQKNWNWKIEKL